MEMLVLDSGEQEILLERRRETGAERWDEVWEGTYIVTPLPDDTHREVAGGLGAAFLQVVGQPRWLV